MSESSELEKMHKAIETLKAEANRYRLLATDYGELANTLCAEIDDCDCCKYAPPTNDGCLCRKDVLNAFAREIGIVGILDE